MQLFKSAVMCSPSRNESQRRAPRTSLTSMLVGLLQFRIASCGGDTFLVFMGCRGLLWGGGGLLETFSQFPFLEVVLCKVKAQDREIKVRMLWPVDMEEKESIKLNCSCSQHHRNQNTTYLGVHVCFVPSESLC